MQGKLSFDQGSSLIKAIYEVEGHFGIITMEPEIIYLPDSSIKTYKEGVGGLSVSLPEDDAWLKFKKSADYCFVLGHLAKQFYGSPNLKQLKFEQGVAKLMAVIGSLIQKESVESEIDLSIMAMLPYGEYTNRQQFIVQFEREAKNFYFRGQRINVNTQVFKCVPEGSGFIANLIKKHGEEWLLRRTVVVLMCGHRNTSLLVYEKGSLSDSSVTTNFGFIRLIDSVLKRTSLDDPEGLTKSIYQMGADISTDKSELRILLKSFEANNFENEASQLVDAIASAREEYWILIKNWLQSAMPKELDELIIAGGAAYYLEDELSRFLAWAEPTWSTNDFSEELDEIFHAFPDKESLMVRFRDIYALHMSMYRRTARIS